MIKFCFLSLFAICVFVSNATAQSPFSISPTEHQDSLINVDLSNISYHQFSALMSNLHNEILPLQWKIISLDYPAEWWVTISDINVSVLVSPSFLDDGGSMQLDLSPGIDNGTYDFNFHPQGVNGCASAMVEMSNYITGAAFDTVSYDLFLNSCTLVTSATSALDYAAVDVFPNPTTDFLNIDNHIYPLEISVCTILGNEVYREKQIGNRSIDLSSLPAGVYVLTLDWGGNRRQVAEIVKL